MESGGEGRGHGCNVSTVSERVQDDQGIRGFSLVSISWASSAD
jgi:hypothetical protein